MHHKIDSDNLYAENGSLRNYLDTNYDKLSWGSKLFHLWYIVHGLNNIHEKELIHRDLHIGNILRFTRRTNITDMGLCKPADYNKLENNKYMEFYLILLLKF